MSSPPLFISSGCPYAIAHDCSTPEQYLVGTTWSWFCEVSTAGLGGVELSWGASSILRSAPSTIVWCCGHKGALGGVPTVDVGRIVQRTRFSLDVGTTKPSAWATSACLWFVSTTPST